MPFSVGRRIATSLAVLALVLVGSATLSLPASAAASPDVVSVTGPADGVVVGGTAVSFSLTSGDDGAGYQLRWSIDPTVEAQTGRLVSIEGGGDAIVTTSDYALIDLAEQTYYWQVRSVDEGAGAWSVPRSFTVDPDAAGLQLETYPLEEPSSASGASPGLSSDVGGGIWIASASVFAVLFLVVVLLGARQLRRAA